MSTELKTSDVVVQDYMSKFDKDTINEITKTMLDAGIDLEVTNRVKEMQEAAQNLELFRQQQCKAYDSQLEETITKYHKSQELSNQLFLKLHNEAPDTKEAKVNEENALEQLVGLVK